MNRWLLGSFDPSDRGDCSRFGAALAPNATTELNFAPLRLACSGPRPRAQDPLCLLDGHLDNAAQIRHQLGRGAAAEEELLGAGYRRWGRGLLERLRGDFALILWDPARGEGLIARDQLGVRPLFLYEFAGGLHFASEIRDLLALLPSRPPPDPTGVSHWIALSTRPGNESLYAGISRLGPGEVVLFDRHRYRLQTYWTPRFEQQAEPPPAELAAGIRGALQTSVRRRLASPGPAGVLLSGGLDSASVAALAAPLAKGELYACSGTFPDHPAADESELIARLTRDLALSAIGVEVRAGGLLASALQYLQAWQMPLLGWGDFWTLPLMRIAAARGVRTLLGGDGGDELFAPRGYLLADRLRQGRPDHALALAHQLPGGGAGIPRRELASTLATLALGGALPYRLQKLGQRALPRRQAPAWLRRAARRDLAGSEDSHAWKRLDGPLWWAHSADALSRGIDRAGVFEHQRRRSASAGLSTRHPLFDLDLVELALRAPPQASLDCRFGRPLLRASMAGLLPDAVRLRRDKAWFHSLIVDCLNRSDRALIRSILMSPRAELGAYVDLGEMRAALFDSDQALRRNPFQWMWQVWRLLTAELWLRSQNSSLGELGLNPPPSKAQIGTH